MSTLKTHNLQSPDASSVNIALAPNAGMVVTGISTFSDNVILAEQKELRLEPSGAFKLYRGAGGGGATNFIKSTFGSISIEAANAFIAKVNNNEDAIAAYANGRVDLYYNNQIKLTTTNTGAVVTGILTASQLILNDARSTLLASDSYNVLEMRADENNDGGNDDNIFKMTHDGTFRSEIRYDESENQLEISTVDNANHFCIGSTGDVKILKNVGIQTNDVTRTNLVGAGNSLVGMYIGDGSILFNKTLNRTGGYYISTEVNALNAGPVSLDATMTLDGTWTIV